MLNMITGKSFQSFQSRIIAIGLDNDYLRRQTESFSQRIDRSFQVVQHGAEVSHIEGIICPRQLIGTPSRKFESPLPFFSSAIRIASSDGSIAVMLFGRPRSNSSTVKVPSPQPISIRRLSRIFMRASVAVVIRSFAYRLLKDALVV